MRKKGKLEKERKKRRVRKEEKGKEWIGMSERGWNGIEGWKGELSDGKATEGEIGEEKEREVN